MGFWRERRPPFYKELRSKVPFKAESVPLSTKKKILCPAGSALP